ncbi:synaptotagmin-3-like isoform X2 [Brevipalpus obovatus]|uniref:synaptotagmin-3-like isoform X2 n=1 Tax=Brevipalpus obovatus TaxID=246614 RepID=UPI003D9EF957
MHPPTASSLVPTISSSKLNATEASTISSTTANVRSSESKSRLKMMNSPSLADVSHSPINSHLVGTQQTSVIILFSISAAFVLCSLIALLAWKRIRKRSRKLQELNYLTSSCGSSLSSTAHFALGIKPDQSIEFVVPTITLPETTPYSMTEDSFTDSDYYPYTSPSDRDYYAGRGQRKRHLTGHSTYLSVSDIGRAYCGPQSEPETAGKVNFVLHYSIHRQQLLVTLLSASDLPASERKGSINPFAKIVLLPEKSPKFHTKVHRNNRNPVFNEMFIFPARKETLDERRLRISIWDSDRFNRKFFVGQVVYNLAESGITSYISSDVITDEILCPLSPHKSNSSTGELSVAVLFKPEIATLTVTINKARGLMVKDISTGSVYKGFSVCE